MFNTDELPWTECLEAMEGRLVLGDLQHPAYGVSTDTRTLKEGELFFALKGPRFDGHEHVPEAFEKGASAAVVERAFEEIKFPADRGLILVPNTLQALGDLAARWRKRFTLPVVGISGSNGKTTTKEMLWSILETRGPTLKNPGNLNNWIGLPLSVFALNPGHRFAVLEMGMNRPGEIARLCQIARPTHGLLTNIGPAHLEGFGSLEAIARAKGELFQALEAHHWVVVNQDDPLIRELAKGCQAQRMTFGLSPSAMVRAEGIEPLGTEIRFRLCYETEVQVQLSVPGLHNVGNALGAAAVALTLGVPMEKIQQGLQDFSPPDHRLQLKKGKLGIRLIDDAYNANPASMAAAVTVFQDLSRGERGGLILGDMLELGPQGALAHKELGRKLGEMGLGFLLTLGPLARETADGAREGSRPPEVVFSFLEAKDLLNALPRVVSPGDWVLVKGSHGMAMEEIVQWLEEET